LNRRVLQLVGSFHQGGSEKQAIALTRMLIAEGSFDVRLATMNSKGSLSAEAAALGLAEIPEFPITSFFSLSFVRQVTRFARYLKEQSIDAVHTHDFYTNIFGMAGALLARVPVRIASKRETAKLRSRMQEVVERLAFSAAHRVVANSEAVKLYLEGIGVASDKIDVVYNGVDVREFAETDKRDRTQLFAELGLEINVDTQVITTVANLRHPVKNIPMLIRAARPVIERFGDVHFVIAGEGPLLDELRRLADELGVSRSVHFLGRCTRIPELLSISTVCVLTSDAEGFSNSILEYMAAGRPVVATRVGGADEAVIDGETGYLIDAGDDAALVDRVSRFLANPQRPKSFGSRGRRVVRTKFDSDVQMSHILSLYRGELERLTMYKHYQMA
jgi:glycosyltransferase involved in cell wall biosynthesis